MENIGSLAEQENSSESEKDKSDAISEADSKTEK